MLNVERRVKRFSEERILMSNSNGFVVVERTKIKKKALNKEKTVYFFSSSEQCCYRTFDLMNKGMAVA
jgi:hypothetical protein